MYSGNFGLGHDAETIKAAMLALKDRADLRFVFVGGGKRRAEIEAFVREHGIANASYRDYVPREQLGQSLCAGDAHLISLREGMEGLIVPSKLFGIMAAARPAIFIGHPDSEIARVVAENDAGFVIREGDSKGLIAAIERLAADRAAAASMGERGRAALIGRYDATSACEAWATLLSAL
jgi:glycosyltransferase involved in cell wall biosynthesis